MVFFITEIYKKIAKSNAELNDGISNFTPGILYKIRLFSLLCLFTATLFLGLNHLFCAVIHTVDIVHRLVTIGKIKVILHLGLLSYCLNDKCFIPKGFLNPIDDPKILAQIKDAPIILKFATVVNIAAFACAGIALILGFFSNHAKWFARLGAGWALAAFLFDLIFYKNNPGGGLGIGFVFTTFAMAILLVFAIIPVIFIGWKQIPKSDPEVWTEEKYLKDGYNRVDLRIKELAAEGTMDEEKLEIERQKGYSQVQETSKKIIQEAERKRGRKEILLGQKRRLNLSERDEENQRASG